MAGTSSYLIDSSKKCAIFGSKMSFRDTSEIPWSIYGDLSTKSLQKLGFSFTENWDDGTNYAVEALNKFTKPISVAINAVAKQIPMLRNVNFEKPVETLRESSIFLKVILDSFTKNGGLSTGMSEQDLKSVLDFDYGYQYHIPMRKGMPTLTPTSNAGIVIEFAYGKCNKFSAEEEVWKPLQALKSLLFPTASDSGKEGLMQIKDNNNAAPAPIPQQIEVEVMKHLLNVPIDIVSQSASGVETKAFDLVSNLKDSATSLEAANSGEVKISEWDSTDAIGAAKGKAFGVINVVNRKSAAANVQAAAEKVGLSGTEYEEAEDYANMEGDETINLNSVAKSILNEAKEAAQLKALEEDKTLEFPKDSFKVKKAAKEGASYIGKDTQKFRLSGSTDSTKPSIDSILLSLATIEQKAVGKITSDIGKVLDTYALRIEMGYAPVYFTNLETMSKKLALATSQKGNSAYIQPAITLQHILIKKASIDFDFDHPDELGFPMAGTLTINELWNLEFPANTFSLNSSNIGNPNLAESIIEPDVDTEL